MQVQRAEVAGLRYIEIAPTVVSAGTPLVIALHGRGSSMEDLAGLAPLLPADWRYVFPQAPLRLDFGAYGAGYSWYEPIPATPERMAEARATLGTFLAAIHAQVGTPPGRSALMGFSQGAVMTLDTGLRAADRYAALVAMSGYLAEGDDLPAVLAAAQGQAALLVHGIQDEVLSVTLGRRARQVLETHGLAPEYQEFAMAHEVNDASLAVVRAFLERHLLFAL